jgi:transcription factor C subunit 7
VPRARGETIAALHDRLAYVVRRIVAACDADLESPRAILVCTHAACMIALGRVLTGCMPDDVAEEDFRCYTASLSVFRRKNDGEERMREEDVVASWDPSTPDEVPAVRWKGCGVAGGWICERDSDCRFLSGGEERGWWVLYANDG